MDYLFYNQICWHLTCMKPHERDNVDDVRFLESREGKNALTLLHVEGIREYFNRYAEKLFLT